MIKEKIYEAICVIRSFSNPDKKYIIHRNLHTEARSCTCMSWRTQRTNPNICPDGMCKHLRALAAFLECGNLDFLLSNHYKMTIKGDEWELWDPNDQMILDGSKRGL